MDLALEGTLDPLEAQAIATKLEELPLPYRFDVKALNHIGHAPLREHMARVGVRLLGSGGEGLFRRSGSLQPVVLPGL